MSTNERHLHVYNPKPQSNKTDFPQFSRLPLDLRLCIWENALSKERFLRVRIGPVDPNPGVALDFCASKPETHPKSSSFQITLEGRKVIPKFLHVSQEARRVTLKFYRVRIPCRYEHGSDWHTGTFYFNPEHDILKFTARDLVPRSNFYTMRFFESLQSADPKGVGLRNLAVDLNDARRLASFDMDMMSPETRETLTSTLAKLRRVYILSEEIAGRMFLGPLNGIRAITGFEMHRSRPVMGYVPSFRRIPVDSRPIEKDLKRTFLGTYDPLKTLYTWKRLIKTYDVTESSEMEYSLMLACAPRDRATILDTESAELWIAQEDAEWQRGLDRWEQTLGPEHVQRESAEDLRNAPQTAIGFWLFPIQALGNLPSVEKSTEDIDEYFKLGAKRVVDLSAYRPQLGVMEI